MEEKYLLVIDTTDYAGSFERELCAYITGQIGECGVGAKQAEMFKNEVEKDIAEWFEENVEDTPDHNGVFRPVALSPTPGMFNDGFGRHYKDNVDLNIVLKKCKSEKIISVDQIVKYPAYQSIEISFYTRPTNDMVKFMTSRAETFCCDERIDKRLKPKKILGVRLVQRVTQDIQLDIEL